MWTRKDRCVDLELAAILVTYLKGKTSVTSNGLAISQLVINPSPLVGFFWQGLLPLDDANHRTYIFKALGIIPPICINIEYVQTLKAVPEGCSELSACKGGSTYHWCPTK